MSTLGLLYKPEGVASCDNTLLLCKLVFMLFTIGVWHAIEQGFSNFFVLRLHFKKDFSR